MILIFQRLIVDTKNSKQGPQNYGGREKDEGNEFWKQMLTVLWLHPPPPHHHYHHLSPNCEGRLGTTDDFATSFLHFSLFSTALLDLPNSRPVHSLMLSSHLFLCLPCLLPLFTVPYKMVWARRDERET